MTRDPLLAASTGPGLPFVSVVIPVRNEVGYVTANLKAVLAQDYPRDRFEVIVADGMSTDGTREAVAELASQETRLQLVENPGRIVSSGLNGAVAQARGDVIVRLDGHCEYPADYIRRVVELRDAQAAASAGGVLVPVGDSYIQRAICAALSSRVGVGGSALRTRKETAEVREVDTVHGGCWRRDALVAAGLFSESMVRNQDDELSFRLRKAGGRIVQSGALRVRYHVRDSWPKLFKQFLQYGYWKVRVIWKHPGQASLRHLMPATLVLGLTLGAGLAPVVGWAGPFAFTLAAAYGLGIAIAAAFTSGVTPILWPGVAVALAIMQLAYGVGFAAGVFGLAVGRSADRLFSGLSR